MVEEREPITRRQSAQVIKLMSLFFCKTAEVPLERKESSTQTDTFVCEEFEQSDQQETFLAEDIEQDDQQERLLAQTDDAKVRVT